VCQTCVKEFVWMTACHVTWTWRLYDCIGN
jgi:hypothetical protein